MLALAALCYLPGLTGPFLFDDFANLPTLELLHHGRGVEALVSYLTSGRADPTGRPVALLTFLLDARDWPADPFPFKRTNLVLHLANGLLLHALLLGAGRRLGVDERIGRHAAIFGAACWLLHPMLVSTTLYAVQRAAILATTFTLVGLLAYMRAREKGGGATGAWAAYVACIALATLSKANGALLPVLAATLELWLPRSHGNARSRLYVRSLVFAPALLLLSWIGFVGVRGIANGIVPYRGWSVSQRLITEPRILLDYLGSLWLPRPYDAGMFNDDIEASTSLVHPWTTLPSLAAIIAAGVAVWRLRHRAPALTTSLAFFFAGHLLESTVVPLELYFEHRNYAAALFMFWPLGGAFARASNGPFGRWSRLGLVAVPLLLAGLTWLRADLWGSGREQALVWASVRPESPRAQTYAAMTELQDGLSYNAVRRLRGLVSRYKDQPQLALTLIDSECAAGGSQPASRAAALVALRSSRTLGRMEYLWIDAAIDTVARACPGIDRTFLARALDAMQANAFARGSPGRRQDVAQLRGRMALQTGDVDQALHWFGAAYREDPSAAIGLKQAALLAAAGARCEARDYLDRQVDPDVRRTPKFRPSMAGVHAWWLWKTGYWVRETEHLRQQLELDIAKDRCGPSP